MLELPATISVRSIEKFCEQLNSQVEGDALVLPVGGHKHAFGGIAVAFQAVCTWARLSSSKQLLVRNNVGNDALQKIIQQPNKFGAAMLARSIAFEDDESTDIRRQVYSHAKDAVERQSKNLYGQNHGRLCWFGFVDHSTKGFDRNFYLDSSGSDPKPRQPAQIQAVVSAMVKQSTQVAGGGRLLQEEELTHLGRIFYELFMNTHEHGSRSTNRSEWIRPGMRLIYTYGINLSAEGAKGSLDEEPVLTSYVESINDPELLNNASRFIEISIVDSGLGFVRRWLSDLGRKNDAADLSMQDEYEIFKRCFTFRRSSSGQTAKGHGLPIVMDRLTKLKGFMRVRSGRLSLYRNFFSNPYSAKDLCDFSDWSTAKPANESLTGHTPLEGVAVTLLIPLEAKQ